jgi:hypothetical protein
MYILLRVIIFIYRILYGSACVAQISEGERSSSHVVEKMLKHVIN